MSYRKRISEKTIQQVKQVDIVAVVGAYLPLKTTGTRHQACCPFHAEKTPSFSVNAVKQIFKCFGCGAAGDSIAFVQKKENWSFAEAVEDIAAKHGIRIEYENLSEKQQQEAEQAYQARKSRQLVLDYALAYYQANDIPATLKASNAAYKNQRCWLLKSPTRRPRRTSFLKTLLQLATNRINYYRPV